MMEGRDVYVDQLHEVFESCDKDGVGMLTQKQLQELCKRLQVEHETDLLVEQLLGDNVNGRVSFFCLS